jgi:hypothetical protein
MLYVETVDVADNADGTMTATLRCDGVTVRCDSMLFFEQLSNDEMIAVFEEWNEFAEAGETGYVFV